MTPYYHKNVSPPANDHKMLLDGPSEDFLGGSGIYFSFKQGTMKPSYIRYKMHPYPLLENINDNPRPDTVIGNFEIRGFKDDGIPVPGIYIHFNHDYAGFGYITANSTRFPDYPSNMISVDKSFLIEMRNIVWETNPPTYDLWIDGAEIENCIPFEQPIVSITELRFFNFHYGRIHFDDIFMADLPVDPYHCPVVSEDPPTLPMLPPPPSPTYTREPIIFVPRTPAFCRSGPGTDYLKLTTFPEDTQLVINGQNIEGTWWWVSEAGCWISDAVGEVQGNPRYLEVIIPPPPPVPEPSDGGPGKPGGCHSDMGQSDCEASGGQWSPPGQPDQCVCP
jgi:hypothetical protein